MQQRTPCYGDMEKAKASAPSLKIAMIAPPWFDIPPRAYGGIEWMCYWLTEGLVARGHDVTFFAAGNDNTSAHFVQTFADPPSDRLGEALPDVLHAMAARRVIDTLNPDIVHDHTVTGPWAAARFTPPVVVTAHGPVDGEIGEYYQGLDSEVALVAISEAQRRIGPSLNWVGTVNNAIPVDEYPLGEEKDDYVLWLGRSIPRRLQPTGVVGGGTLRVVAVVARHYGGRPQRSVDDPVSGLPPRLADVQLRNLRVGKSTLEPVVYEARHGNGILSRRQGRNRSGRNAGVSRRLTDRATPAPREPIHPT